MTSVATLDPAVAHEWLRCVYGEAEASAAMRLSWELRVQLYPEVLTFGPSGAAVAALFSAVERDFGADGIALGDTGFLIDCLQLQLAVDGFRDDFALPAGASREQALFDALLFESQRFWSAWGNPFGWSVAFMGMALSVEWFSPGVRAQFAAFTGEVNDALKSLQLPALGVDTAGVAHA